MATAVPQQNVDEKFFCKKCQRSGYDGSDAEGLITETQRVKRAVK